MAAIITILTAEFSAEWSNPLWSALELDVLRESDRIARAVRRLVDGFEGPPPKALDLTDESLGTPELPVLIRSKSWLELLGPFVLAGGIVVASWWHRPKPPAEGHLFEDESAAVPAAPIAARPSIVTALGETAAETLSSGSLTPQSSSFGSRIGPSGVSPGSEATWTAVASGVLSPLRENGNTNSAGASGSLLG